MNLNVIKVVCEESTSSIFLTSVTIIICLLGSVQNSAAQTERLKIDKGWRFLKGGFLGAETVLLDDSNWRMLDLPHDWSIEDRPGVLSPFDSTAIGQVHTGFTVGGTGWYRKHFTVADEDKGKRFLLQFEGVYMNADVWINEHQGNHPYGYTEFDFDITQFLKIGSDNVIAVEVKNEGVSSRWYTGSGIYRHVWLEKTGDVYTTSKNISITTPFVSSAKAKIQADVEIINASETSHVIRMITTLYGEGNDNIATTDSTVTIQALDSISVKVLLELKNPKLWYPDSPSLYFIKVEIMSQNKTNSTAVSRFGIREIRVTAESGLTINGRNLKLKGACVHHDNGPLGSASYDRAEERKIQLLKQSGFNAIRCAHNPPSTAFLNYCDELGMVVVDEAFDTWREGKTAFDYHLYFDRWWRRDLESMVRQGRNHPSVICWSIGNEIPERGTPEGIATATLMTNFLKVMDPTRLITAAVQDVREDKDAFFKVLDIAGYNYGVDKYVEDHRRVPGRIILSTESYPLESFDYWSGVEQNPWVIGDFVWAGFDYIGEASIGWLGHPQSKNFYPWNLAYCGDLDICGWKRPQSFYRDVLQNKNHVALFVRPPEKSFPESTNKPWWSKWYWHDDVADWNWEGFENRPIDVIVYASTEEVELFLNGKSLGRKQTSRSLQYIAKWKVPYVAGELKASGLSKGKVVSTSILKSSGPPAKIKLSVDRALLKAGLDDLAYVTVEIMDREGNADHKSEIELNFEVQGVGSLAGAANANPRSTESFQSLSKHCWRGRCLIIIKAGESPGKVTLKVSAKGLPLTSIDITVNEQ